MKQTYILGAFLCINAISFAQTVEQPVHVKTESNGVKIYTTNGNENKNEQVIQTPPPVQPIAKTINDYTVEEIDNILYGLNEKLQFLEGSNEFELIQLMKDKKSELLKRRKVLTGSN